MWFQCFNPVCFNASNMKSYVDDETERKKKFFNFYKYACDNITPERKTVFCFVFFFQINEQINESK